MTAVTLSWDDPEDAAEFLALRRDLRRQRWLPDPAAGALLDLVGSSVVMEGGRKEDGNG